MTNEYPLDLLDAVDALGPEEPIDWLVDDFIELGSVVIFSGAGGTGKTYAAIDLAVCVAIENHWLDFTVHKTKVLIIDEQSGKKRLKRRLGRVLRGHLVDKSPLQRGDIQYTCLSLVDLRDDYEYLGLSKQIKDIQGVGLVIIDALIDISRGAEENSATEMQPVLQHLRIVAEDTGAAILVIHHTNKLKKSRGSTVINDCVDLAILVDKNKSSSIIEFETDKVRDIAEMKFAAVLNYNDVGQTWLSPTDSQKREQKLTDSQQWVMDYLQAHGASKVADITQDPGSWSTPSTAKKAIAQLVRMGLIYRVNPDALLGTDAIYDIVRSKP